MSRYRQTMAEALKQVRETTYGWTLVSKAKDIAKKFKDNMTKAVAEIEKLEKGLSKNPTVDAELRKYNESLDEKYTVVITKKDGTTMELGRYNTSAEAQRYVDQYGTGAKIKKEESDLEEASLKDIFTSNQEGKKADEIAKKLGMSVSDIKKILGEEIGEVSEENLDEFTSDMIKRLKKSYSTMPKKLSTDQANALSRHLDRLDLTSLKQLSKENIPFITTLARNKIYKKTGKLEELEITEQTPAQKATEMLKNLATAAGFKRPSSGDGYQAVFDYRNGKGKYQGKGKKTFKQVQDWIYRNGYRIDMGYLRNMLGEAVDEPKQDMPDDKEKVAKENSDKEIASLKDQIAMLKTKLENEKNKAVKPEPNPKTGEVPLTIGIANKLLKDKEEKEAKKKEVKEMAKDDAYAIGMAQAKKSMNDEPPLDKKTITKGHEIAKSIIKKEETLDEFTSNMIKRLQISYADLKGKTLSPEKATALSKHLDRLDTTSLRQLVKANIPFMSTLARNKIYKKTGKFEERRQYIESIAALTKKADKSGMPYSILKQVYDRGMAAWKGGHRPGASQHQWAFARVNSFITKSSGTWGGADKDLAAKVKG